MEAAVGGLDGADCRTATGRGMGEGQVRQSRRLSPAQRERMLTELIAALAPHVRGRPLAHREAQPALRRSGAPLTSTPADRADALAAVDEAPALLRSPAGTTRSTPAGTPGR